MEFKGTKGKWEFIQNTEFPTLHEIWSDSESIFTRGTYIARTCFAPASKANALLISKAPEMLEMLIELIDNCCGEQECEEELIKGLGNTLYNSVFKAKQIIKQATDLNTEPMKNKL